MARQAKAGGDERTISQVRADIAVALLCGTSRFVPCDHNEHNDHDQHDQHDQHEDHDHAGHDNEGHGSGSPGHAQTGCDCRPGRECECDCGGWYTTDDEYGFLARFGDPNNPGAEDDTAYSDDTAGSEPVPEDEPPGPGFPDADVINISGDPIDPADNTRPEPDPEPVPEPGPVPEPEPPSAPASERAGAEVGDAHGAGHDSTRGDRPHETSDKATSGEAWSGGRRPVPHPPPPGARPPGGGSPDRSRPLDGSPGRSRPPDAAAPLDAPATPQPGSGGPGSWTVLTMPLDQFLAFAGALGVDPDDLPDARDPADPGNPDDDPDTINAVGVLGTQMPGYGPVSSQPARLEHAGALVGSITKRIVAARLADAERGIGESGNSGSRSPTRRDG